MQTFTQDITDITSIDKNGLAALLNDCARRGTNGYPYEARRQLDSNFESFATLRQKFGHVAFEGDIIDGDDGNMLWFSVLKSDTGRSTVTIRPN